VLELTDAQLDEVVAHCLRALPLEGCGLLLGDPSNGRVTSVAPASNVAASSKVYAIDPAEHLRIDRVARSRGEDVIGAFHSHTHTDAWPSPTDVASAVDESWHWVIVSLRDASPIVRSFRIESCAVSEEPIVLP
jgi:proteasome lid subunit RPN8/RPN11